MSEPLLVALIAGVVSVATVGLTELARWILRGADKRDSARVVYLRYVDPLNESATALLHRIREAFKDSESGYYLKSREHYATFEHYKALSTLYRLAVPIAWIRALRRELFFLTSEHPRKLRGLESAITEFQQALADGSHVESLRLKAVLNCWPSELLVTSVQERMLCVRLDYEFDRILHGLRLTELRDLSQAQARETVDRVVQVVAETLGVDPPDDSHLEAHWGRCFEMLAIREAWVYRDWQSAIGDVLLRESPGGPRRFDVVGFREFEELCATGSLDEKKWLRRLNATLDEVDTSLSPTLDARVGLLTSLQVACGRILLEIHALDVRRSNVSSQTLELARQAVALSPQSP